MYAVIKTGGKQYQVAVGDKLKVEVMPADVGSKLTITDVLMIADGSDITVGTPTVDGATVTATVVALGRHKKVRIFKMQRRKHYQKHQGHRQDYMEIQIDAITK